MTSAVADGHVRLVSGSEEELTPNPPKRGRARRGRRNNRASRLRSSRTSAARNRSAANQTIISVGDIDTDEEDRPRACSPVAFPAARATSPMGINCLAAALGVTDWSPLSNPPPPCAIQDSPALEESGNAFVVAASPAPNTQGQSSTSSSSTVPVQSQCDLNQGVEKVAHSAPKKTSRRGLAKKEAGLSSTALSGFHPGLPDTAVYSHCVPLGSASALAEEKLVTDFSSTSDTQSLSENESVEAGAAGRPRGADIKPTKRGRVKVEAEVSVTEISEVEDNDGSVLEPRCPSPPPQPKAAHRARGKMNKKLSNALKTINNVKGRLQKLGNATPNHKFRRLHADVMFVEEDKGLMKKDMVVKVRYLSTIHRVSMNLDDPLHRLTSQLGDKEAHKLSLFLDDQVLDLNQTVRAAKLSVADILDCHHMKSPDSEDDTIKLVVQCHHSRSKTILVAHKHKPLSCVSEQYATTLGVDPTCVRLVFDGEDVDPSDTPSKLNMEDEDVLDVVIWKS